MVSYHEVKSSLKWVRMSNIFIKLKYFDKTKVMSFMTKDNKLIEEQNAMWDKVNNLLKKSA